MKYSCLIKIVNGKGVMQHLIFVVSIIARSIIVIIICLALVIVKAKENQDRVPGYINSMKTL